MNNKDYNNDFVEWIYGIIYKRYMDDKKSYEDFESFMILNLYLITINFDVNKIINRYKEDGKIYATAEYEMRQFKNLYNMVCRSVLGRDYHKIPAEKKPLSVVCVDADGSRYWKEMGDLKNIHLHSIWLMDSGMKGGFDKIREKSLSMNNAFDIKSIDVKRYNGDIKKVISYIFKFDKFNIENLDIYKSFEIYPK